MQNRYYVIDSGVVYVDYGPITMTLEARRNGSPFTEAAAAGAEAALDVFSDFVKYLDFLKKPVGQIESIPTDIPQGVRKMTESVMMLEEGDFTSLAAVAGTTSDFAVSAMKKHGADYAVANNGGDIAWYISPSDKDFFKVGLISDVNTGKITHSMAIRSFNEIRGIATSGLGGRSLTRGIASAVTVLASDSSKADAAATAIANACYCEDPAIKQCLAKELDYGTDIPDLMVTVSVGKLREGSAEAALSAGCTRAKQLMDKDMILGAVLFVGKYVKVIRNIERGYLFEVEKRD